MSLFVFSLGFFLILQYQLVVSLFFNITAEQIKLGYVFVNKDNSIVVSVSLRTMFILDNKRDFYCFQSCIGFRSLYQKFHFLLNWQLCQKNSIYVCAIISVLLSNFLLLRNCPKWSRLFNASECIRSLGLIFQRNVFFFKLLVNNCLST